MFIRFWKKKRIGGWAGAGVKASANSWFGSVCSRATRGTFAVVLVHCRNNKFVPNCFYLVVPPELGKPVWVNDPEDFGFLVFPLDVGLVAAVGEELVHVIPQQPAV